MLGDRLKTFAAVLALCLVAGPALADAIDGNWCHNDGRRLSIRGAEIVTPGGLRMEGNYSRHWFTYVVPTAEPGAGQTIFMTLLDEHNVDLRRGEATASPERWVRCSPSVS